ncbi:hypothetical protein BH11ACT7_BH11ACT7_14450 [soil metagenome]
MSSAWLIVSRVLAVVNVAVVTVLFLTAGKVVQEGQLLDVHGSAAIALHVSSGLLTLALVGLAREAHARWWAPACAFVLFGYSFVQAYLGEGMTLYMHIPGALLVAALSVWLAAWLFLRPIGTHTVHSPR